MPPDVGDLIDALSTEDPKASLILRHHPELLDQRVIHNETPLHFLVIEGKSNGVRFALELGASPNSVDEFGDSPLHHAIMMKREDVVEMLLQHGAHRNIVSPSLGTPLDVAEDVGAPTLVALVKRHGCLLRADQLPSSWAPE